MKIRISDEEMAELFPLPFIICLNCDMDAYRNAFDNCIRNLRLDLNKELGININSFSVHVNGKAEEDDKEFYYTITIGNEDVAAGYLLKENLHNLLLIIEGIVRGNYQKILDVQNKNDETCYFLEKKGEFAILHTYYSCIGNTKKAFHAVKKAAAVNTIFLRDLKRYYMGRCGKSMADKAMARKIFTIEHDMLDKFDKEW